MEGHRERQLRRLGRPLHQARLLAPLAVIAAVAALRPHSLSASAWLGGLPTRAEAGWLGRRSVGAAILGGVTSLTFGSVAAVAEEDQRLSTSTIPSGRSFQTALVQGPTKDFVVSTPVNWITQVDNYAGRLVYSQENSFQAQDFASLVVARLTLPALMNSAKFMPRDIDKTCSKWEEVALGDVTTATIAKWMVEALQKSMMAKYGFVMQPINDIVDAQIKKGGSYSAGSELTWHAMVTVPKNDALDKGVQGSGGRLVTLSEAASGAPLSGNNLRMISGKALLRGGIVVYAVVDAPKSRFEQDYNGTPGKAFFDELVSSLELTPQFD